MWCAEVTPEMAHGAECRMAYHVWDLITIVV